MRFVWVGLFLGLTLSLDALDRSGKPNELRVIEVPKGKVIEKTSPRYIRDCDHVILRNEASRFAVVVWCEDALGTMIGILDLGHLFHDKVWQAKTSQRFWSEEEWSEDSAAVSWSPDGMELLALSGCIYGSCSLNLLNLEKKTSLQVFGLKESGILELELVSVDWNAREATVECIGKKVSKREKVSFTAGESR